MKRTVNYHTSKVCEIKRRSSGMTMVEVLFAMAILAILATISSYVYIEYIEKAKIYRAIDTISALSTELSSYGMDTGFYPQSLDDVGQGGILDPWGNPYVYMNIANAGSGFSGMRKDHHTVPINTDFDLYSKGPDGKSVQSLTAKDSIDDIIRGNDGQYIGPAAGF